MKREKPPDVQWDIDWAEKAKSLGIKFIPTIQRHQYMAYHGLGDVAFHRKERIKMFWPNYQWHRWNERRLKGVCNYHWLCWLGPGASAKTTDAACFGVEYWLEAPDRTAVVMCSTTMKMLRMRIWNQAAHWHQSLPKGIGHVGELLDSVTRIRWNQGDDKNGIFGMAVEEGNIEEVIHNLIGIHTERVLLILDEAQGIREAIMRATNNMAKNPRFDCWLLGNPDDFHNPLVREAEPIGGWDSIVRGETPEWETKGGPVAGNGLAQFFDGRKSPADDSPEERLRMPWLINADWVANHLKSVRGNLNDPTFWSQAIGFPPATGLESTLLDDAIIQTFHCKDKAVWTEGFIRCAFLDPARTGGDKRILQFGKRGRSSGIGYERESDTWSTSVGKTAWIIEADDWVDVPIDVENKSRAIDYQIVDFCKVECKKRGISHEEFSLFSTGAGGPLLSIFRTEWSPLVMGIEEGGSPSERVIDDTGKTAKEAYDNRASELQFNVREFAVANGIRGLNNEASFQYCSRRTFYRNGKWCIEPKVGAKGRVDEKGRSVKGFKERLGFSPDHGDAFAGLVAHCMSKGAEPNVIAAPPSSEQSQYQQQHDEFSESNYLNDYEYK